MLEALPELGPWFMVDEVLGHLAMFVQAKNADRDEDLVRRAFEYVEWLRGNAPPELAAELVEALHSSGMTWPEGIA
jgi:hypothetical protein